MDVGYTKYTLIRFSKKKKKYKLINVREQVSLSIVNVCWKLVIR